MTYRDDLEAERARIDALEERARALEAENTELRAHSGESAAVVSTPRRAKTSFTIVVRLAAAAFAGFMLAMLAWAIIPATTRLAAPLLCPSGYSRSLVVVHVYGGAADSTTQSDLWCVPSDGDCPTRVDRSSVVFTMCGELIAPLMVLALATRRRQRSAS